MKKQNENGRIPEDRLSRANKRKKNNTTASSVPGSVPADNFPTDCTLGKS